jgi:hypothetical protein
VIESTGRSFLLDSGLAAVVYVEDKRVPPEVKEIASLVDRNDTCDTAASLKRTPNPLHDPLADRVRSTPAVTPGRRTSVERIRVPLWPLPAELAPLGVAPRGVDEESRG